MLIFNIPLLLTHCFDFLEGFHLTKRSGSFRRRFRRFGVVGKEYIRNIRTVKATMKYKLDAN